MKFLCNPAMHQYVTLITQTYEACLGWCPSNMPEIILPRDNLHSMHGNSCCCLWEVHLALPTLFCVRPFHFFPLSFPIERGRAEARISCRHLFLQKYMRFQGGPTSNVYNIFPHTIIADNATAMPLSAPDLWRFLPICSILHSNHSWGASQTMWHQRHLAKKTTLPCSGGDLANIRLIMRHLLAFWDAQKNLVDARDQKCR